MSALEDWINQKAASLDDTSMANKLMMVSAEKVVLEETLNMRWMVYVDGTKQRQCAKKSDAVKWARQYAKDMKESSGTPGKVIIKGLKY